MQRLDWLCDAARLGEISKRRAWALLECALASMCFPFSSSRSLSLSVYIHCVCVCVCVCVCAVLCCAVLCVPAQGVPGGHAAAGLAVRRSEAWGDLKEARLGSAGVRPGEYVLPFLFMYLSLSVSMGSLSLWERPCMYMCMCALENVQDFQCFDVQDFQRFHVTPIIHMFAEGRRIHTDKHKHIKRTTCPPTYTQSPTHQHAHLPPPTQSTTS